MSLRTLLYKHSFLFKELDNKNQSWVHCSVSLKKNTKNMKRFFQPIEKDGSFKKPTISSVSSSEKDGEQTTETISESAAAAENKKEPTKFLTWNANSFLLRIKNNWTEFTQFIESLDPDVIAIQVLQFCLYFYDAKCLLMVWLLCHCDILYVALVHESSFRKKKVTLFVDNLLLIHQESREV